MKPLKIFAIFFLFFLNACGSSSVIEQTKNSSSNSAAASLSLTPGANLYVAAAFFTDPVGSIAAVGINSPHPVTNALAVTDSSDLVVRGFAGRLYVINRGTSTIQVFDPTTMAVLGNYSVGASSNPQDLVVANGKAYITRYDAHLDTQNSDDLFIVDPLTGNLLKSINLKPYTTNDGDRKARAGDMKLVGNLLYILIQDLSATYRATTEGKVAILNTSTDTITQVITLAGRNPTSIAYSAGLNQLFITDTGFFDDSMNNDTSTTFGGIEIINLATNQTLGIKIDDANFNGYLFSVALVSDQLGVVAVSANSIATFQPTTQSVIRTSLYTTPSGFIPEILIDKNNLLWIPERDPNNDGMVLYNPSSQSIVGGPFPVGALPSSMALIP